jgi:hypothetical protein
MSGTQIAGASVDLNGSVGDWLERALDVQLVQRLHIEALLDSGTWGTAVVEVLKSGTGAAYYSFTPPLTFAAASRVIDVDVHDAAFIQLELDTAEGAAGVASFQFYGDGYDAYRSGALETIDSALATQLDEASATVTYVGKALPGTATSAALWRVFRMTETGGDLSIEYADGDANFDNVWDNRASLSYS